MLSDKEFAGIIDIEDFNTEQPNPFRLRKFAQADRFNRDMKKIAKRTVEFQKQKEKC